jgi:hypothetical protein
MSPGLRLDSVERQTILWLAERLQQGERTVWFDEVDGFLNQIGAQGQLPRVSAVLESLGAVHRYEWPPKPDYLPKGSNPPLQDGSKEAVGYKNWARMWRSGWQIHGSVMMLVREISETTEAGPASSPPPLDAPSAPAATKTPAREAQGEMPPAPATSEPADLSDLVPGDDADIRRCLDWEKRLDQRLRDLAAALLPALNAEHLGEAARAVVMERVHQEAGELVQALEDGQYRAVLSENVIAWVAPLLGEAAAACRELALAAKQGPLPADALGGWLSRIKAPTFELRRLQELLVFASVQRTRERQAARATQVGDPDADVAPPPPAAELAAPRGDVLTGPEQAAKQPTPNPPPDAAIKAYRLKWVRGVPKQAEIAKLLSEELGRQISQGQVSRWLQQAEAYADAVGLLPGLSSSPHKKAAPMDPQQLDLGARQDGRTERQRERRSDDD